MISGKRIILGVTGGIAAYKAAFLLREFQKKGAAVRVCMTPSATRFVGKETFSSLSGHEVAVDIFPEENEGDEWTRHINWGEWADLYVIAPCTANTLGKIANGLSDNMLTATVLAARCPVLICPTMDGEMYDSPAVRDNLSSLSEKGYHILEPESGYLASGLEGKGRLPEIETIIDTCSGILGDIEGPLKGKKVIVTAGATREYVDPVRFLSNPSSGKMGIAMARAAKDLGAEVTLFHGSVTVPLPDDIHRKPFGNAEDLFQQIKDNGTDADVVIMAAAVSDFTPEQKSDQKIKKSEAIKSISLKPTTDILSWLGEHKKDHQVLIGFAMETQNLVENATDKRKKKNADWILANTIGTEKTGFEGDYNTLILIGDKMHQKFEGSKNDIAIEILNTIFRP